MMVPTSPVIAVATVVKSVLLFVTIGMSNMTTNATITNNARMNLRSASLAVIGLVTVSIDSSAGFAAVFSPSNSKSVIQIFWESSNFGTVTLSPCGQSTSTVSVGTGKFAGTLNKTT